MVTSLPRFCNLSQTSITTMVNLCPGPDWKNPSAALPMWLWRLVLFLHPFSAVPREFGRAKVPWTIAIWGFLPSPGGLHTCFPGGGVYRLLASLVGASAQLTVSWHRYCCGDAVIFNSDPVADMFFIWLLMWPLPMYLLIGD